MLRAIPVTQGVPLQQLVSARRLNPPTGADGLVWQLCGSREGAFISVDWANSDNLAASYLNKLAHDFAPKYHDRMARMTFREIRRQFPDQFLVLFDPEEKAVSADQIEVTGARDVRAFDNGDAMFQAYRQLKREGHHVTFCTPHYKDHFIVEQVPLRRIIGQ